MSEDTDIIQPYITSDDLIPDWCSSETFRMLTADLGDGNPQLNFERFCLKRQGPIDDSLRTAGYALPLASVPSDIKEIACVFVLYGLYFRRPGGAPKHIADEYLLKQKRLDLIRTGALVLGGVPMIEKAEGAIGIGHNLTEDDIEMSKQHISESGFPIPGYGGSGRGLGLKTN